jgi:hypothetical protein
MPPATGAAQAIFGEALELPPASRTAFLDAACRGDAALRAELDDLLAVYERMGRFLDPSGPRDEGTAVNGPSTGHSPAGEFPPFHPTLTRTPSGAGAPGPPSRTPTALGGYRIERPLGEGGMGAVYLACDDKLGRAVALKTMRPEVAARPGAVERFLREAQATARVAHDNVVPILHVGEDAGVPYIVRPLLEGEPLDRLLKRAPAPPLGVVLKVGREIADGLAAAHARGLVHRDIKPANVWLEGNPQAADPRNRFKRVKVLDFGLVRPAHDDTQLTGPGAVLGTPAYMAPEQARGEPVDARTDLFSLGVVLYRMTTGRAPFAGSTAMAVLTALAVHHPPAPAEHHSGVPKPLSDLIMRLLAKDRDGRPASAAEVAAAVRRIGRQLAAARKARALPVVVPVPAGPPAGTHFDPWTEIDTGPPAGAAAPLTRPAPAPAPRVQSANRRAVGVRMRVAAGLVAFLALGLAAVVVIRFDTPEGTLVVEVSDPEVEARFKGGKLILAGPDGRERYTLTAAEPGRKIAAGKYLLRVEGADGLALDTSEFTLRRRDEVTVRVTLRPPPSPSTDHPAAAWVFSMGGTVRVRDADRDIRAATDLPKGAVQLTRADLRASARVTDAGLAALANCAQLRHLDLNGTGTSDAGLLRLKKLAHLSTLRLGKTRVTDAGLEHLGALTRLTELCLSDDPAVGGSGLKHLGGLKGLTFLNLNGSGVTDPGLAGLAGLTKLTRLYLRGTGLTAPALAHLKDMTELRWLELIDQPVGDAGLERLAGLAALEHLDVRGKTNVTAAGVEAFAGARAGCRVVWNGGVVGPPAADRDAAAWVLSVGGHVTVEGAAGGGREVGAADGLPAGPLTVTGVSFQHVPEIRDADLARLKGLPALAAVSLHGKGVTDAGLEHLRGARALMSLTLTSTKVTDGGLKCLTGLGALRRLDLNSTGITDAGLEHLNRLPALAELELGMTGVTDAGLGALKDLKLTALYLGRTAVTDAGLKHLEGQAGLATLELARTRVTGAGVRRLAKIRALQWLNLSGIPLADGDLSALKELKLQTLFLSGTPVTDAGLEHLAAQHALSRLWADDTAVTDGAADKLKKALPRCEILR